MKIALIKETKIPQDNRVILSPAQMKEMMAKYPEHEWVVESSDIRAYSDDEYRAQGVEVTKDTSDCDILFGIKEPKISSLHADKHYFSFGHIAKEQVYNRPLAKAFIDKRITFTDYEYLTDDNGVRVCAFGWWAGISVTRYNYNDVVEHINTDEDLAVDCFPTILPGYDRTARAGKHAIIYDKATPEAFAKHVEKTIEYVTNKDDEHKIIILKSWNEWGEGNYMEPDLKYGHKFLDVLRECLFNK